MKKSVTKQTVKRVAALLLAVVMCISLWPSAAVKADQTATGAGSPSTAEVPIENNNDGIPDKALYNYLLKSGDANKDGILTMGEAEDIYALQLYISDGMELVGTFKNISKYLPNLSQFEYCDWRSNPDAVISAADIEEIGKLKNIRMCRFSFVHIPDTSTITKLGKVNSLELDKCGLSDISFLTAENFPNLEYINMIRNPIREVPDSILAMDLCLIQMDLCEIEKLPDLSKLSNLTTISLCENNLTELPDISGLTGLECLDVRYNELKTLPDLTKMSKLKDLMLDGNYLTEAELKAKLPSKFTSDKAWMTEVLSTQREFVDITITDVKVSNKDVVLTDDHVSEKVVVTVSVDGADLSAINENDTVYLWYTFEGADYSRGVQAEYDAAKKQFTGNIYVLSNTCEEGIPYKFAGLEIKNNKFTYDGDTTLFTMTNKMSDKKAPEVQAIEVYVNGVLQTTTSFDLKVGDKISVRANATDESGISSGMLDISVKNWEDAAGTGKSTYTYVLAIPGQYDLEGERTIEDTNFYEGTYEISGFRVSDKFYNEKEYSTEEVAALYKTVTTNGEGSNDSSDSTDDTGSNDSTDSSDDWYDDDDDDVPAVVIPQPEVTAPETTVPEIVTKPETTVPETTVPEASKSEAVKTQEVLNAVSKNISEIIKTDAVSEETRKAVEAALANGETITASVSVGKILAESAVSSEVRASVEQKANAVLGEGTKVAYLDISLFLTGSGSGTLGTLNKLEEPITVTVALPSELQGDYTYKVIRNHVNSDGTTEVAVLDAVKNADGTISFKTDRFSTYAIAYSVNVPASPKTNDGNMTMIYLLCAAFAVVTVVSAKKMRVQK